jgi:hypothetical protein
VTLPKTKQLAYVHESTRPPYDPSEAWPAPGVPPGEPPPIVPPQAAAAITTRSLARIPGSERLGLGDEVPPSYYEPIPKLDYYEAGVARMFREL